MASARGLGVGVGTVAASSSSAAAGVGPRVATLGKHSLPTLLTERPQTKKGGVGVAVRTYGRLIIKRAAFSRASPHAESYLRREAPCPPQAPKICSISPASQFSTMN